MTHPTLFDTQTPAAGLPIARPAAAGAAYTITLPTGLVLLNSNQRLHHHPKGKRTAAIRAAAHEAVTESPELMAALAAAKPGPLFHRAHILGVYHPPTNGRCDPANWYPSFKAAVDGLVDAGLLDDDDHARVAGPDMRLGRKVKGGQIVLVIRALEQGEDWPDLGAVAR
ncbi:hypothetical protein [Streptomyces sp.]|uniref:hypothetical protein n=1 Tax=Streptomyces sp. TaxID=1931 RepID=UPI002D775A4E|nr:hypothetical protein [Streptomyces sp.]HET6356059.1 hypothetical protein [Streptomyces sp.]